MLSRSRTLHRPGLRRLELARHAHQAPLLRPQPEIRRSCDAGSTASRCAPSGSTRRRSWTATRGRGCQHEGRFVEPRQGPTDGPEEEVEDSQGDALPNQCWDAQRPSPRGTATSTLPGTSSHAADDGDSRIRATKTVQANINALEACPCDAPSGSNTAGGVQEDVIRASASSMKYESG
jgi:hypothetical protein